MFVEQKGDYRNINREREMEKIITSLRDIVLIYTQCLIASTAFSKSNLKPASVNFFGNAFLPETTASTTSPKKTLNKNRGAGMKQGLCNALPIYFANCFILRG
jgi:hypothetical protein